MRIDRSRAALILALISLAMSGFLFLHRPEPPVPPDHASGPDGSVALDGDIAGFRESLKSMSSEIAELRRAVGDDAGADPAKDESGAGPRVVVSIDERLRDLESALARLQSNYDGISIEGESAERARIFASDNGAIKADEYYEAGKYSIAAEGYLTYYRNHPDDPDSRGVLERARRAYGQAGYSGMAMWVQEEMMRIFPESRAQDLTTLATMKKEAGNYDDAIAHSAEAAALMTDPQSRLWTRLYWAWYNELRDGSAAGLSAYLQVQREIESAGFTDHKLSARAREKIDEVQKQIAVGR